MLKFTVIGTYEDNGQRVALHVEAKDPTDAEKAAQREAIKLNGWNVIDFKTGPVVVAGVVAGHVKCLDSQE